MRILILCSLVFLLACKSAKNGHSENKIYSGTMKNLTGLDGCGWIIEKDSKKDVVERFEPVNLREFKVEYQEGTRVKFSYAAADGASICMAGKLVLLKTFVVQ